MQNANAAVISILMVACFTSGAYGAAKHSAREREMTQFAKELSSMVVYRSGADIAVSAQDCRLHIEFTSRKVAFDLPLAGTKIASSDSEDGVVLSNDAMTRTVGDRVPEAFPSLILHSNHLDVRPVMKLFEHAIALCSDMRAAAVR